jgi:predicted DNA-binding protein
LRLKNHPCSESCKNGFLELARLKTSSIRGYGTIHLLSSEFVYQSTIEADQPAGREWLVTEQCSELVQRTATRLSAHFTEQLERTLTEHPTRTELANVTETIEAHARTLTELAALPGLFEQLQQEIQAVMVANTEH